MCHHGRENESDAAKVASTVYKGGGVEEDKTGENNKEEEHL